MKLKFNPNFIAGTLLVWSVAGLTTTVFAGEPTFVMDSIAFGDSNSETNHGLSASCSEIIAGGLGERARILLPLTNDAWEGGRLTFTLKVDPQKQNYATVRLWGSDATDNQLVLFCEGKQVGYRHLGDIDILDIGNGEPAFPGRFLYTTTPLPFEMTRGKSELFFEIRSYGPTWGYAGEFEKFQKPLVGPTRGIYRFYTHTDGCFVPPACEKQGAVPADPPVRQEPGAEVMDKLKARVNGEIKTLLAATRPLNEMQMEFLARAYFVKWTPAFENPKVVKQVLQGLDALFLAFRKNPELAHHDPATPNPDWFEFGPAGDAIRLLAQPLKPFLDETVAAGVAPAVEPGFQPGGRATVLPGDSSNPKAASAANDISGRRDARLLRPAGDPPTQRITRRRAYSEMLVAGRDWHRKPRRLYTNQTMIQDLNIYLSNRGLEVVDPANALSETEVRRYLYEAVGLEPWRDSDPGPDSRLWGVGTNYWQLTAKGLTKELGFVGYYGEVLDWVTSIYDATRPAPGLPGDEKIKAQLGKIANARAPFRAPGTDADGFRAMRAETIVGWRDGGHYPGNVIYSERPTWDASPLYAAAATLDSVAIGYAQQMFADGQFFISLERQMAQANNLRVTAGLLGIPDQYELIKSQSSSAARLPMTPGQPDFVFSDEEDGVVVVKNGDEILYASLYWRARNAVNFLARVHFTTPLTDHIAVLKEDAEFEPSGEFYTRPDWTTFGFSNGGPRYPQDLHSAIAGEKLPIAKIPDGVRFRPGDESAYAGKAEFYTLHYGNYLVGMNLTTDKTFALKPPEGAKSARELVSGKNVKSDEPIEVAPHSTAVLWFGKQ